MAEQLSIDILRAQMAQAVAARNATPEVQAPEAPAEEPAKVWATENQQRLIHTMIFERFPAAQAKHMYASLDWTKIRHREFKAIMNELKALPKLPRNLRDKAVVSPEVSLPGDFPHGTYTVQYADDSYKVIRIALQPLDEDFMPGVALIGYQNGPNNKKDFRNFANVRPDGSISFWRRWTQPDLEKALVAVLGAEDGIYTTPEGDRVEVTKSDYCAKCGDVLTAPSTKNPYRDMGYGPECGKKVGLKK